jgi:uncharacterized protein (TIGR03435 family)
MCSGNRIVIILVALASVNLVTAAQDQPLNFDVASIKPDVASGNQRQFFGCRGTDGSSIDSMGISLLRNSAVQVRMGRCVGVRTSLGMLLHAGYEVRRTEKKPGAPDWIETDQFAIEAKADGPTTAVQLQEMVRTLLRDRFKLEFHRETQQVDGFVLSVAKNGSKLKSATGPEYSGIHYGPPPEPGQNIVSALNVPFADFFKNISEVLLPNVLGKPVIDQTYIEGNYLGLHLEPQRGSIELFLIDQVEKPDANKLTTALLGSMANYKWHWFFNRLTKINVFRGTGFIHIPVTLSRVSTPVNITCLDSKTASHLNLKLSEGLRRTARIYGTCGIRHPHVHTPACTAVDYSDEL